MNLYQLNHNLLLSLNHEEIEGLTKINANTTEAALEKHIPEVRLEDNNVHVVVGSTIHPMMEAHYIMWIALETTKGTYIRYLNPGEEPKATFTMQDDEKAIAVYEFCNLHGVWKKEL